MMHLSERRGMNLQVCKVLGIFCLSLMARASGADWPQFLGPHRDGVADESEAAIARTFPAEGPVIKWKTKLGTGFAGPVVADGKVIVFHRVGDEARVEALDAESGKQLWSFGYATDYVDSFGFDNGPRASSTIAEGKVIVHGAEGVVHAINLATGEKVWSYDTVKELQSEQGFFGRASAPLIIGKRVIIICGGRNAKGAAGVIALGLEDGKLAWQSVDDQASYSSPVSKSDTLLCWMRNQIVVCDAADGRVYFQSHLCADMDASVNAATPIWCSADTFFTSACYGVGAALWKIQEAGTPKNRAVKLQQLWAGENALDSHYGTPVLFNGNLYGFHGRQERGQTLRCIRASDGKVMWESERVPGGGLLRARGILIVVTEAGELWLVEATPDKFNTLATAQILHAGHRSFPAFSNGVLYARDGKELVAVELSAPSSK